MILAGRVPEVASYRMHRIGMNPAWNRAIEIVKCPTSLARRAQWFGHAGLHSAFFA